MAERSARQQRAWAGADCASNAIISRDRDASGTQLQRDAISSPAGRVIRDVRSRGARVAGPHGAWRRERDPTATECRDTRRHCAGRVFGACAVAAGFLLFVVCLFFRVSMAVDEDGDVLEPGEIWI